MPKNTLLGYRARRVRLIADEVKCRRGYRYGTWRCGSDETGVVEFRRGDDAVASQMLCFVQGAVGGFQ